jgi:putative membrane protein
MNDNKPPTSDELALRRTVLALDRTLMAWTRTSLSLISFGFTIYKFLQYAREEGAAPAMRIEGPRHLGMAMIGMGVVFLLLASIQFWREMKRLEPSRRRGPWRLSMAVAMLLAVLGLLALANVAFSVGPF